jgi:hypothetical protein
MSQTERAIRHLDTNTMPLTDVSIEYGTEGLLIRFDNAVDSLELDESERVLIYDSLKLALDLHSNDKRTYEPYANHIIRVALRLIENLKIKDAVTIAASLLHDSIEDHPRELAAQFLDKETPRSPHATRRLGVLGLRAFASQYEDAEDLPDIILEVSNPILAEGDDKKVVYERHINQLMHHGLPMAKMIKIADLYDNTDVPDDLEDPEKRRKMDEKQEPIFAHVEAGLTDPNAEIPIFARDAMILAFRRNHQRARRRMGEESSELKSA